MGKSEKKHGKGRLDHYYRLAKEKGYRARSSFKIIQLNQKYGFFNPPRKGRPMCVIDLCAAPGSWCQVATQCVPPQSLIVGVDLAPIKPLPNVISFQSDITTDHCRSQLRGYLKTWKADVVMHDGAPNVGMAWAQDAFTQSELVLQSLKLAVEFLAPGGWFVTKVFRSKDYNKLMWVFQQFFEKCEATKPPSSRNVSAEIFVVCRGFRAPSKIDPKLLDPIYVFEELQENNSNNQQKVYNPEKKTRKRQGYEGEEGKLVLEHKVSAVDFIKCEDPIQMLGESTEFMWDKEDPIIKQVKKLPQTTGELVECFKDLKVLGKKDFRMLLRWRKACRKLLGLDDEEKEEEEKEELTTEQQIDKEMENLTEAQRKRLKRERRKRNEMKQKEIYRMQVQNGPVNDIIIENNVTNQDGLFDLKRVERAGQAEALVRGKHQAPILRSRGDNDIVLGDEDDVMVDEIPEENSDDSDMSVDSDSEFSEDEANEALAGQLDNMYAAYKEQQAKSAEARALRNRETEWHGIESADEDSDGTDDDEMDSDELSDAEYDKQGKALSGRASMFFDNPLFNKLQAAESESDAEGDSDDEDETSASSMEESPKPSMGKSSISDNAHDEEDDEEDSDPKSAHHIYNEAQKDPTDQAIRMTLAQQLALGKITKHDLINEGYNKVAFRDKEELPEWFLEDEAKHTRYLKPITKEASMAAKEAEKALNARPIKKVMEAKGRKQMRANRRLERIRKKSDLINEDSNMSEREKSEEIAKLLKRSAAKKTRPKVTVVKSAGQNKGLSGRPRGVRGKYKMVDGTMKKEQRAIRRIQKKRK